MKKLAENALRQAFEHSRPDVKPNCKDCVESVEDNLLPYVNVGDFKQDLRNGAGNQLGEKFRSVHSSAALAVNCFAPFRRHPHDLHLLGYGTFDELEFERGCPIGLKSGHKAYPDIVLSSRFEAIGIESKLTEHLGTRKAKFSCAYECDIQDERRNQGYFQEMRRLKAIPGYYRRLDAAQLIKHAYGLYNEFKHPSVKLLYIYWEPKNWQSYPIFREHREEVKEFSKRVEGARPTFSSMSYPDLWSMLSQGAPGWLRNHIQDLEKRYLLEL